MEKKFMAVTAAFLAVSNIFAQNHRTDYIETPIIEKFEETDSHPVYVPYSDDEIEKEAVMAAAASGHVDPETAVTTSESSINWTKNTFTSDICLDVQKAKIPMPSGKGTSVNKIQMELPILVKDPLLSIYVDDSKTLSDLLLEGQITLESLTRIIDSSKRTPAVFASGGAKLLTKHTIDLHAISSTLVKHKRPYMQYQPIETVSSRKYTGIVLDARGLKPVHGEFIKSNVYPCLFPKVWTEDLNLIYERNMVNPEVVKTRGIVHYSGSDLIENYTDTVGKDPLWITVRKVYGVNRCDPVISNEDYLRIASVKENLELLKQGKVTIILDKDLLEYKVAVPEKNRNYFISYHQMKRYFFENKVPDVVLTDVLEGIQITMQNLRFKADSAELLPEENSRIAMIAKQLKEATKNGGFQILIEGHTADVNKPNGQQRLSMQRAQAIVDAMAAEGIDRKILSSKGFGGTKPVADNGTAEGRALNRRVEIVVMPKSSYVMRE